VFVPEGRSLHTFVWKTADVDPAGSNEDATGNVPDLSSSINRRRLIHTIPG